MINISLSSQDDTWRFVIESETKDKDTISNIKKWLEENYVDRFQWKKLAIKSERKVPLNINANGIKYTAYATRTIRFNINVVEIYTHEDAALFKLFWAQFF